MKVAHIITRLEAGGSTANVLASARTGETVLICGRTEAGALRTAVPAGTAVWEIPMMRRSVNPALDFLAFLKIALLLRRVRPDIVHTHTSKAGILGRWAAFASNMTLPRSCRAAVVHTPHGHVLYGYFGGLKTFIYAVAEKIAAPVTDALIALSSGELEESLSAGIGSREQWVVIPSGVDFPPPEREAAILRAGRKIRAEHGIAENDIIAGTVARLEPVKGVRYFLEAAKLVRASARFMIVGGGSEREFLERRCAELGLAEKIIFAGHRDNPLDWMAAMDIYIQPSLNEGLGRTVIEAQFLRKPVAGSNVCGIKDIVKEGVSGFLVPPADPSALAGAVDKLAADAGLRRAFGEAGRAAVIRPDENGLPYFSGQAMARNLDRLYGKLCGR
ncbi:MAG: glycosyltransferase family 4 protein [Elusimicrobiales bacterium]